ncbi:MAG: oligosaccharide flippase family protein, partial [Cyclobacteriaceae bacterium]|nr:oligosaccharide flippase family protein [Cyclobacteriaceae bacterium]
MFLNSDSTINKKSLYNSSFILNIGLTILIIIIILIVSPFIGNLFENQIIKSLLYFYTIKLIIISIGDHFDIVQEANYDFKGTFLDLFLRSFVFVGCIIFCFLFNIQIPIYYLVIFQIIGAILGVIFSYWNSIQKQILVVPSFKYRLTYLKKLTNLGKFTFGSSASSIAMRNVDTWMLGAILNTSAVALYNPAIRVSNIFEIPTSTMSTILMPKLANKINESGSDSVKYYYEKSVSFILAFMIPIVALGVLFSNEIIFIIAGEGFAQAGYFLKFTMFYGLLIPFNRQFSITLDALGKPKFNFIVVLFTLLLSVILNITFITQFGIIGAIYGTLITYSTVFVFAQIYLYKSFGISLFKILYGVIPGY